MEDFLISMKTFVDALGASVLLPIVIFFLAVILGAKVGKAIRAGVTIGVAFIGINLVIGLMWTNLSEVAQAIASNTGITRDVVDIGWPSSAAIAFGSQVGLWVIPIGLTVNIILLFTGMTRTLNVDVWNFWHFAFTGSLVAAATGSLAFGLAATALMSALSLFFADWSSKSVQKFYQLPGVSVPHLLSAQILPIAIISNWIIDRLPIIRDVNLSTDRVKNSLGIMGEPIMLGLMIGSILGLVGFWDLDDAATMMTKVLQVGINLAAVMVLLPRMVKILMEGLIPVSEAARDFVQKRAGSKQINIGLDSAILIGHPAAISSSLLLIPIAIVLSVILPGNRVILFADLAVIPFVVALAAPVVGGNVFRMVIIGTITLALGFYVAGALAPLFTETAIKSGFSMPQDASYITAIGDGFVWITWSTVELFDKFGIFGGVIIFIIICVCFYFIRTKSAVMDGLVGVQARKQAQETDEN